MLGGLQLFESHTAQTMNCLDVVIESFTPDVKVIAKAATIWRTIEPDKNDIARKGVQFLKRVLS